MHLFQPIRQCPPQHCTLRPAFLPAIDSNCLCSFISSCAANYLPAPFPVFPQQPRPCTREGGGRRGGKEKGRAPLLWHRHKGIPSTGLGPPTLSLSSGSQTHYRPHTLLSAKLKETHERDEAMEIQRRRESEEGWQLWGVILESLKKLRERDRVNIVSGRSASRFTSRSLPF